MEENSSKKMIIIGFVVAFIVIIALFFLLKGCSKKETKEFLVTFDSNGGSVVENVTVKENEMVERPSDPTKEGYIFAGWYYNDRLFDFNTKIKEDITITARWVESGKLTFETENMTLNENESDEIKILAYPSGVSLSDLLFTSNDESIVKVDVNGKITALKSGTAVITIKSKDGKYVGKVTINVNKKEEEKPSTNNETTKPSGSTGSTTKPSTPSKPKEIEVTNVTISGGSSVTVGGSLELSVNITPSNATNKSVTWSIVSGSDKATIDQNGKLKALSSGKVTVKVTTKNGKTATKEITISSIYKVVLIPECTDMPGVPPLRYQFFVYRDGKLFNDYIQFIYNGVEATPRSYTIPSKNVSNNIKNVKITLSSETVNATVTYQANDKC